ncbi:alpha/beta hydrolase [Spirilliplanes yamanashiensis]|uniref:Alpha/beta hydrolase n=1 Tax=Spirilliplanes yamanashiensis TaxID=42233 RepID=A0A8J3YCA7_9ACTN|nr:alpha/beta hydrolase [Spirilliplanes yamanashiensis]MDP9816416.1 acetyl esterase [Spirilliplanes yamanashiensis]GIJ05943.1 alpha/beta hydrolase [Spirilliplanes yamanashiensis]
MLHPQVAAALAVRRRPTADQLAADPAVQLAALRAAMEAAVDAECGPELPLPVVVDVDADGVPCRLYATRADAPVFVYVHGGGWTFGSIATHDRLCRRVADRSGCAVLSVGYRLAPEHPFPAALDDVAAALAYLRREGRDLGVDPSRLAIGGDSAGGHLATVTARRQRDQATPLDHQVLIYPTIDPLTSSESHETLGEYGIDRESTSLAWQTFAPHAADRFTPDVAPLAADLAGMPPTLMISAEYDVLRDENEEYADALLAAGVPVVHVRYQGVNHGFARKLALYDAARAAADQVAMTLRAALLF